MDIEDTPLQSDGEQNDEVPESEHGDHQKVANDASTQEGSNRLASGKKEVRRRPPVMSHPADIQDRCMNLGGVFKAIEDQMAENGGVLPHKGRRNALKQLRDLGIAQSITRYSQLLAQYQEYRAAYPDSPSAEAFSPHKVGRPTVSDIPPEAEDLIWKLYKKSGFGKNTGFQSLNYDGSLNTATYPVKAKVILSGVLVVFPEYADRVALHDVYNVIARRKKTEATNAMLARSNGKQVTNDLPSRNSDIEGVNEQWQFDIRPLPWYMRWGDIICTAKIMVVSDHKSRKILAHKLIPGVKAATNEPVVGGEFTSQLAREVMFQGLNKAGCRPRMFYPDRGIQWRYWSLGPYMQYLSPNGETPTKLIFRSAEEPRGGGHEEQLLGDLDRYGRKFAGFYDEREENYRDVLRRVKDDVSKLETFEMIEKDLSAHIDFLNTTAEDGPSREQIYQQGPDFSLPLPPDIYLLGFARLMEKTARKVQHYGFDYDSKKWEFENDIPEVRALWTKAKHSPKKRALLVYKVGTEYWLYMDLEDEGLHWERAIVKGKPRNTKQEDRRRNDASRRILLLENAVDSASLDALLRERLDGGTLVIRPDGTKLVAYHATSNTTTDPSDGAAEPAIPANLAPTPPPSPSESDGGAERGAQADEQDKQSESDGGAERGAQADEQDKQSEPAIDQPPTASTGERSPKAKGGAAKQKRDKGKTSGDQQDKPDDLSDDDIWSKFEGFGN